MTSRRSLPLSLMALAVLIIGPVAGCGDAQQGAPPPSAETTVAGFPVTVTNCGATTTYERAPQRAVTMNQHVTEIMLALGLEKSMVGTAFLDDRIPQEYETAYNGVKVLAKEYPSYETLLSVEPDFVYGGFQSAFDDKEGRGRDTLAKAGIDSHLNLEACPSGPVTMDLLEEEIRTVGRIFGVSDRAETARRRDARRPGRRREEGGRGRAGQGVRLRQR